MAVEEREVGRREEEEVAKILGYKKKKQREGEREGEAGNRKIHTKQ